MYLCFMFICGIINIRLSESLYQIKGVCNMFEKAIEAVKERIQLLESKDKKTTPFFSGSSLSIYRKFMLKK